MPANTSPVFSITPNANPVAVTAANTKSDGTGTIGTDIFLAFTAGSNGSWVSKVRVSTVATAAATTSTGTVGRIYLSTKTSGATTGGTDTFQIAEFAIPSVVADHSANNLSPLEVPISWALKSGQTILVSTHAAPAANTGQHFIVVGGDY